MTKMKLSDREKQQIKQDLVECLKGEPEVRRVVVFGSFAGSSEPGDLDIAVFQDSDQPYLPLAMKYRRLLRPVARRIPLDVVPLRAASPGGWFVRGEVMRGEVVFER